VKNYFLELIQICERFETLAIFQKKHTLHKPLSNIVNIKIEVKHIIKTRLFYKKSIETLTCISGFKYSELID
jgi:hypothetical protein